jgi:2'-5' RNA ligase
LIATPPAEVLASLVRRLSQLGIFQRLGDALFPIGNWHQSLSGRLDDTPPHIRSLVRAGARVMAPQFLMTFNRVGGGHPANGVMHWSILARGKPKGLAVLLSTISESLQAEGMPDGGGHSPHLTISYNAPTPLPSVGFVPVTWAVSDFALVRGGGEPYRYEVLKRLPLLPPGAEYGPQRSLL